MLVSDAHKATIARVKKARAEREGEPPEGTKTKEDPKVYPMVVLPNSLPLQGFHRWLGDALIKDRRIVRLMSWFIDLPWRGMEFLRVVFSGRVDSDTLNERMIACYGCPARVVVVTKKLSKKMYCHQCGCPRWKLSQLQFKNSRKGWECPRNLHKGPYRLDRYSNTYSDLTGGKPLRIVPTASQGKGGCGR